jgi:hypothetical protein
VRLATIMPSVREEIGMGVAAVPLNWADLLPRRPRRILVTGCSGSGKTTVAAALSEALGVPHHELDALFHGPDWIPRPTFVAEVAAFAAADDWAASSGWPACVGNHRLVRTSVVVSAQAESAPPGVP